MTAVNELLVSNPAARPTDQPASRDIDAPPGVQHLENFAKLVDLVTPPFVPVSADVVTDNAVLLDSEHAAPLPVGTLGPVAAVSRVTHAFTPTSYSGAVEFAPPVNLRPSPFDGQPDILYADSGGATVRLSVTDDAITQWPGRVLMLFASEPYTREHSACPAYGHLVPETAEGRLWFAPLEGGGYFATSFAGYRHPTTGQFIALTAGVRYFATVYLTKTTAGALPKAPGATRDLLSYPSATLTWIQGD